MVEPVYLKPGENVEVYAPTGQTLKVGLNNKANTTRVRVTSSGILEPTPSPPSSNPSGQLMPTTEPTGWRRVFEDDFTVPISEGNFPGMVNTGKWASYPLGWTNNYTGHYDPKIISVHDSVMDIHLRTEDGIPKIAAPVPLLPEGTPDKHGWKCLTYGRVAVRFKADAVPDYKTAWLFWPVTMSWPQGGEIDFPEGDLDGVIKGFMHRQDATVGNDQDYVTTTARYTDWHTAVIEWSPSRCAFILDGVTLGVFTSRVPNTAMRYVMQTETHLTNTPPPASAQGHVLIDWITVAAKI